MATGTRPRFIFNDEPKNGIRYGRKLSLLEGYATVRLAFTWAKEGQEQGGMNCGCDNVGDGLTIMTVVRMT